MPIAICIRCGNPAPDSFHDFKKICTCRTKQGWVDYYKKMKWCLKIDGKEYDFTENGNSS